jgi:uncharacterized membrane protein
MVHVPFGSTTRPREAKVDFETTVEIAAPAERVWDVLTDVVRWPEWTASVRTVERLDGPAGTGGPLAVGSRVRIKQPKMPTLEWEVTTLDPSICFAWRAVRPGVTTVADHRLRALDDQRVSVTLGVRQTGALAPVFAWVGSGFARRYVHLEAAGLKARSEGR